jgi:hypothetical protein
MRTERHWSVAFIAGAIAALAQTAAPADTILCDPPEHVIVRVLAVNTTSGRTMRDLPGASFTYANPGGNPQGCLIVQFSAQVRAKSPQAVRLRLIVNAQAQAYPATVDLYTSEDRYDARQVTFVVPNVGPPGIANTFLRIQYMSVAGGPVTLTKGLLRIWYDQ